MVIIMKHKTYKTNDITKKSNTIFHLSSYEATKQNKPYIISASKSGTYSKLDKAEKKEFNKLKKELKDYTKYDG